MPLPVDPETGKVIVQGYIPSIPLCVVGIAVFAILAGIYTIRWFHSGRQRYMLWVTLGSAFMAVGFGVRVVQHFEPTSIPIYSISTLIILLSPCAFIAQDYYTLPHLASRLGADDCLFLRPQIVGRLFLTSDCITFFIQLAGSGMTAVASVANVGSTIAMVGLIAQAVSFLLFTLLLLTFGFKVKRNHPNKWSNMVPAMQGRTVRLSWREDWRTIWWALCWTTIGILIRCVFRVVEFQEGYDGHLRTTEPYFYLLDSLPLALAIAVWVFVWPPSILNALDQTPEPTYVKRETPLEMYQKTPSSSYGSSSTARSSAA